MIDVATPSDGCITQGAQEIPRAHRRGSKEVQGEGNRGNQNTDPQTGRVTPADSSNDIQDQIITEL